MKVRTQLSLLAFVLVTFCLAGSYFIQRQDTVYFHSVFQSELVERRENIRRILDLYSRPLQVFSKDYSVWDDLVSFTSKPDPLWAQENIDASFETFGADVVWIYNAKRSLVYSVASDKYLSGIFDSIESAIERCKNEKQVRFFLDSSKGPVLVYGASIHPTNDVMRQTPAAGYFFVGRLWDEAVLKDLETLCSSSMSLFSQPLVNQPHFSKDQGSLIFSLPLEDVSKLARNFLVVKIDAPELTIFEEASKDRMFFLLISLFILFIGIAAGFIFLVDRPLRKISHLLATSKPVAGGLCRRSDEFGRIAQIISKFKQQKLDLEKTNAELKDMQEQLIQSSKMVAIGQLAAGISHELNQPLTGIKGFAQMALELAAGNQQLHDDLVRIIDQANRMDVIIRNVRFFARKSDFSLVTMNINQPLENALMLVGEQFKVYAIEIEKDTQAGLPDILGDANQLQQVFLNLLTNARDAIEEAHKQGPGKITITSRISHDRHWVEVSIKDSGCGIALKHRQSIFNPFYTTKSPNGGMGLGLAIVYRIIESHKGSISFESVAGEGTVFTVRIPVAA